MLSSAVDRCRIAVATAKAAVSLVDTKMARVGRPPMEAAFGASSSEIFDGTAGAPARTAFAEVMGDLVEIRRDTITVVEGAWRRVDQAADDTASWQTLQDWIFGDDEDHPLPDGMPLPLLQLAMTVRSAIAAGVLDRDDVEAELSDHIQTASAAVGAAISRFERITQAVDVATTRQACAALDHWASGAVEAADRRRAAEAVLRLRDRGWPA